MFRMQNTTGHRIRIARRLANLTQEELAARLQIRGHAHTRNTIAKIETGVRQVTDVEIKVLADVLGVTVSWLFEDDDIADH